MRFGIAHDGSADAIGLATRWHRRQAPLFDSVAMTAFNLIAGLIAWWVHRQLGSGEASASVIAAFSGVLFVFTVANLAIGVALAPRYAGPPPDAIYGNNLAQQITSTFDVVICGLSLAVLVAMLFSGPPAGYLVRRHEARIATASVPPKAPSPEPATSVAPKLCGVRNPRRCRELCGSKWIRRPCSRLHRRSGSCPANRHRTRRLGFPLPRMMMTRRRPIGHRSIG